MKMYINMQKPDVDTLTIINLKRKLENNLHCNTTKKNKMSKNKFNQEGEKTYYSDNYIAERN